jgi:hypothetical protein
MEDAEIQRRVNEALEMLVAKDSFLLVNDAGERTIAARLACYMVPLFPDHDVDVEYNRHGVDSKRAMLPPGCRTGGDRLVYPDIVVHHRGDDRDNLLVVELKKTTNNEPRDCDFAKIAALKEQYGYTAGVFIEMPAGRAATTTRPLQTWL